MKPFTKDTFDRRDWTFRERCIKKYHTSKEDLLLSLTFFLHYPGKFDHGLRSTSISSILEYPNPLKILYTWVCFNTRQVRSWVRIPLIRLTIRWAKQRSRRNNFGYVVPWWQSSSFIWLTDPPKDFELWRFSSSIPKRSIQTRFLLSVGWKVLFSATIFPFITLTHDPRLLMRLLTDVYGGGGWGDFLFFNQTW